MWRRILLLFFVYFSWCSATPERLAPADEPITGGRGFLDYLTAYGAVVAAVGALAAAGIGLWQGSIANQNYKVSRESLTDTQRAFVFPTGIIFQPQPDLHQGDVEVIWKNSGTTPTRNLHLWTSWGGFNREISAGFGFPDLVPPGSIETFTHSLLGPQSTMVTLDALISADAMNATNRKEIFFYIYGWARYNDVFPETIEHVTRFCYRLGSFSVPGGQVNAASTAIYSTCQIGNCADDECRAQGLP